MQARLAALGAVVFAFASAGAVVEGARDARTSRGLIVYWNDSRWPTLFSIRPDGSRVHRILRNRQNAKRPRLSPDRRWVAFDGASPGKPPLSDFDVMLVRLDGTGLRTLTRSRMWDHDAQWSPDGRLIAFSRMPPHHSDSTESTIWIMRRDGGGLRRFVRGSDVRWSPTGERLVFTASTGLSDGDLFVIGRDGRGRKRLTATPAIEAAAAWSPDARRILFTRFAGAASNVFVMNARGGDVRKLATGTAAAWSPDGSKILYTSSGLYVMNVDGSGRRKIAAIRAYDPDWR